MRYARCNVARRDARVSRVKEQAGISFKVIQLRGVARIGIRGINLRISTYERKILIVSQYTKGLSWKVKRGNYH